MITCPQCFRATGDLALVCPSCKALIHARTLEDLASRASAASDPNEALPLWRQALTLLPPETKQYGAVIAKIDALPLDKPKGRLKNNFTSSQ